MANFAWLVLKQKTIKTALSKFRFYLPLKKCLDLPLCNLIYPLHWLKLVRAVVLERKISSSLCLYHAPFEKDLDFVWTNLISIQWCLVLSLIGPFVLNKKMGDVKNLQQWRQKTMEPCKNCTLFILTAEYPQKKKSVFDSRDLHLNLFK